MPVRLFSGQSLHEVLTLKVKAVDDRLHAWNPDALLNAAEADVGNELVEAGVVECPTLLRHEAWMPPQDEVVQHGLNSFTRQPVARRVSRLTLVVPFTGDRSVFQTQPNTFTFNPPVIDAIAKDTLRLTIEGPVDDPQQARVAFDNLLGQIGTYLNWARAQIDAHNGAMTAGIPARVSARRTQLLAGRNMQAEIGYPIRYRADADTFRAPIKRRTVRPIRPTTKSATTPYQPTPAMADADFEAALKVLAHSRNALERNPTTVDKLDEEQIRDILLINLNAFFEGDAAGEVFNGDGKTDILVRVDDGNIFIGECKIWSGNDSMTEALGQIFKYLVWRDTKAAILLFIRNKDVTAVIDKAAALIEAHPNYKRTISSGADGRYEYVMHTNGDTQREIRLVFMPFALRTKSTTATG